MKNHCIKHGIYSQAAYDDYEKNKFAKNSLYIYHGHAESDIPVGIEYEVIARMGKWNMAAIRPDSVQEMSFKGVKFFYTVSNAAILSGRFGAIMDSSLIQFEKKFRP